MELKSYYRLNFINGQEFFVESDIEDKDLFVKKIKEPAYFSENVGFITLQRKDTEPLDISSDKLFSVQKAPKSMIGAQTKLWRLV